MANSENCSRESERMRLTYLCLQATREGQASHAHVHEIIRGLQRRGWTVDLFEPHYARRERQAGLFAKLVAFATTQLRLWFRLPKARVLYVRSHPLSFPSVLLARLFSVPTVYEINSGYEDLFLCFPWTKRFSSMFKIVMRIPLQLASQRIAVTQGLKEWANREAGEKVSYVIPNGASAELFHPDAKTDHQLPQPYAIFFGTLARWQGLGDLLAAVNLPEWPHGVNLVIVGDGVERKRVEEAARNDSRITYLPRVPYRQMPGVVAGGIVGLCPKSNYQGGSETGLAPLKLFETMASGIPIVVTDFPGQADMVRESGCGVVIPEADPEAIANAVRRLAEAPDERHEMGKRGREAVVAKHSWDCRAAATSAALLNLLSGKGEKARPAASCSF